MTQASITDLETLKERLQRLLTEYCNDPVLQGCAAALEELIALRRPVGQSDAQVYIHFFPDDGTQGFLEQPDGRLHQIPRPPSGSLVVLLADYEAAQREIAGYSNAHAILMAERDEARSRVAQLTGELDLYASSLQTANASVSAYQRRAERLEGALREAQDAFVTKCAENLKSREFLQFVVDDYRGYKPGDEPTPGLDCVQRIEIFLSSGLAAADGQQPIISAAGKQLLSACGLLSECAQFMDAAKECDSDTWTYYDQLLRDRVSAFIREVLPPAAPMDDCKPSQRDLSTLCGAGDGVAGE